jgi:hypothetical protein
MKMYAMFGGGGNRNKIWTKTAYLKMSTFFKFRQKITGLDIWKGFGSDLEYPNIWLFEHLD